MHGLAAGIIFFRNGSLRCALLPKKKIPPAALTEIVGLSSVGIFASEVKRSKASHEDAKVPRIVSRVMVTAAGAGRYG